MKYGEKWIGHRVWDCSGLTRWAADQHGLKYHHGSNSMYLYDSSHKGVLTSGMELPIGAYVYTGNKDKKPHIGTYTGDGYVTEASGSNAGVIRTKLHGGKWKYWSLGKGITYDFIPEKKAEEQVKVYKKGSKGSEVKKIQQLLLDRGYKLPKYGADGSYGAETEAAVKQFQKDWGLAQDGIVGPETLKMLENTPEKTKTYTVTIKGATKKEADELKAQFKSVSVKEE